ncbi:MAG: DUF2934 domain-containing protein [Candidatus Zapsychrus exili]|nr:DUF2934 domain-containing protein [Candidatus Zapsychrus exili]
MGRIASKIKKVATSMTRRRTLVKKPQVTDEMIAQKAYELYESRGSNHGGDFDDWAEAKKILGI